MSCDEKRQQPTVVLPIVGTDEQSVPINYRDNSAVLQFGTW